MPRAAVVLWGLLAVTCLFLSSLLRLLLRPWLLLLRRLVLLLLLLLRRPPLRRHVVLVRQPEADSARCDGHHVPVPLLWVNAYVVRPQQRLHTEATCMHIARAHGRACAAGLRHRCGAGSQTLLLRLHWRYVPCG